MFFSAFFSASETALTSISELRARHLLKKGKGRKDSLVLWIEHPQKVLTTILIGNNIANIFASVDATVIAQTIIQNNVLALAGGIMTFVILIFGELTPKTFAKQNADLIAPALIRLLEPFYYIFYPFTVVMLFLAKNITFESSNLNSNLLTEDELEFMVEESKKEGVINEDKHKMLKNIFDMSDTIAREIMTQRLDIKSISDKLQIESAMKAFAKFGHSRMPVYEKDIDNILGILNIRDLISDYYNIRNDNVKKHMKQATFIPETKPILQLLKEMQNKRLQFVVVLDEYGGTSGLITVEDIIEEIVGEIEDEDDKTEEDFRKMKDGSYIINCRMSFDDFVEKFLSDEFEEFERTDFDTIGGFIMSQAGCIPKVGAVIDYKQLNFTVVSANASKLISVKLKVTPAL